MTSNNAKRTYWTTINKSLYIRYVKIISHNLFPIQRSQTSKLEGYEEKKRRKKKEKKRREEDTLKYIYVYGLTMLEWMRLLLHMLLLVHCALHCIGGRYTKLR